MISLRAEGVAVAARAGDAFLTRFDFSAGPGVHAIVGSASDGAGVALAVLCGAVRPSRGVVTVDAADSTRAPVRVPDKFAWARRHAPRADPLRVRDAMILAASIRAGAAAGDHGSSEGDVDATLAAFGLGPFALRPVASLTEDDAHRVAVASALGSRCSFVLLEEPFAGLDIATSATVAERIEAVAAAGSVVVVATASRREAVRLGARTHRLVRGVSMDTRVDPDCAHFVVTTDNAFAFATALTEDTSVHFDIGESGAVHLHAETVHAGSLAIGRAAERAGVDVSAIELSGAP